MFTYINRDKEMVRNKNSFKDLKINVSVSDPWEFVTEFGSPVLCAT